MGTHCSSACPVCIYTAVLILKIKRKPQKSISSGVSISSSSPIRENPNLATMSTLRNLYLARCRVSLYSTIAARSRWANLPHLPDSTARVALHPIFEKPPPPGVPKVGIPFSRRAAQMSESRLADAEIQDYAKMAVEKHNTKAIKSNRKTLKNLEFVSVVNGYVEIVAGHGYYLVLKVKDEFGNHKYVQAHVHREPVELKPLFKGLKIIADDAINVPPFHLDHKLLKCRRELKVGS